ncbi:3-carboxyethylcatechol 2,3-dioxygenase [Bradyrhizobium sp. NP1]|uniref:3-carboxyethylcatechol 2,3-dioxygenase n=1 Tax=Bradyrhizobium sp. NP1 TaxID=3049772 RepID=UPI0025A6090B|nr:3-carboxyethylcatechol 2,3-dioxygenase [Bradyrhizobium sp. NP1]WJR76885.1 3-carboxyethylcatechol 2,3-dioxygenase [Bradyrhizobium sp. NP1]
MITGAICISHSPLMDRKRAPADVEQRFNLAVRAANRLAAEMKPDLTVLFFPDHLNGFFYNLLPPFCVGVQGESIGDYGTAPGRLDIPEAAAMDCAAYCIKAGIDVGISYQMKIDHGGAQPVELLSSFFPLTRLIPIFINCVAAPRPSFERARVLGRTVGEWACSRPERILFLGSGGLAHDPPLPTLATANPQVRERLTTGATPNYSERVGRQNQVFQLDYKKPGIPIRPLNPEWDRDVLAAFAKGNLDVLDNTEDDAVTAIAGSGAHELRSWIAALAAVTSAGRTENRVLFYEPIQEWITGMGIMTASPARD